MASEQELRDVRLKKRAALEETFGSAYPAHSSRTHDIKTFLHVFDGLADTQVTLAGRIMKSRGQGALVFFDMFDGTELVQCVIKEEESGKDTIAFFNTFCDAGDFIEARGTAFTTRTGQRSLLVTSLRMLAKALLPLPDKYHGLVDDELRVRHRYLDILTNRELRDMIEKKAAFWKTVRNFFDERGFIEVETPTLEVTTGGAEARPFVTHHHDFDMSVYLRISVGELWQKRLMAAGFPKTYEIGRAYRNEGSSPDHLQEFTNCEFYIAYADYKDGMQLVKELYRAIATNVFGTTRFTTRGHTFDFMDEWVEVDYKEEIQKQTGIDINEATDDAIRAKLAELKIKYDGVTRERLIDTLWKYCRKTISGPAFLVNHPLVVAPLSKANEKSNSAQKFQPILAGSEVGNGYSELNDPIDQRQRFELQQELIDRGDEEAMMPDWDFVEMLEHGMPPTCGFGFGDRLFAFLMDKPIRETELFPLTKPKK